MLLFWERGYEGTSMTDLTQAMGVNPSSIYAAIGDKRALLSLAAKRYMDSRVLYATKALEEPTLEEVVRALLDSTVSGSDQGCSRTAYRVPHRELPRPPLQFRSARTFSESFPAPGPVRSQEYHYERQD